MYQSSFVQIVTYWCGYCLLPLENNNEKRGEPPSSSMLKNTVSMCYVYVQSTKDRCMWKLNPVFIWSNAFFIQCNNLFFHQNCILTTGNRKQQTREIIDFQILISINCYPPSCAYVCFVSLYKDPCY